MRASCCRFSSGVVRRRSGARPYIVVNERADLALAAAADGVHLRADGPATIGVRALGAPGWIVGRSVHTQDEIRRETDASYLLFGTVFASRSKDRSAPVQGVDALAAAVAASPAPLLAIGGITPVTAAAVRIDGHRGRRGDRRVPAGRIPTGCAWPAGRRRGVARRAFAFVTQPLVQ